MTGTAISGVSTVYHRTIEIDGLDIFCREAGDPSNPTILLLHGFPTSSHMFRNLIPALADQYHLVAPDFPGYGNSSMPAVDEFDYTFDHLSQIVDKLVVKLEIQRYSLYLMDYGAPVGFRIATAHPERVQTLIIQNGNVRIPDDREHRFQSNVNTDSGHVEQRFQDGEHGFRGT